MRTRCVPDEGSLRKLATTKPWRSQQARAREVGADRALKALIALAARVGDAPLEPSRHRRAPHWRLAAPFQCVWSDLGRYQRSVAEGSVRYTDPGTVAGPAESSSSLAPAAEHLLGTTVRIERTEVIGRGAVPDLPMAGPGLKLHVPVLAGLETTELLPGQVVGVALLHTPDVDE